MAETAALPPSAPLPTPPRKPNDLVEWAARLTVALAKHFQRLGAAQIVTMQNVPDGQFLQRSGTTVVGNPGGGGGTTITVNGVALASGTGDLDNTTPAPPAAGVNVKWQKDALSPTNISAYVPQASLDVSQMGGTLGIGHGGTSATTAAVAFDNLTPATTQGDLIGRGVFGSARIPVGVDGSVLSADSTQSLGVAWVAPLVPPYAPGSFTVADGHYAIVSRHLTLTGTQRATLAGNATLRMT
jgi:hypothetical protein